MVVAYLLLFLLSASACDATSRNQRLFLPSPAIHDHPLAAVKDLSYDGVHYHPATTTMMGRRGGSPPPWALTGVPASGSVGEGAPPPPEEATAAMSPPPSLTTGVEASGTGGGAPPPPEDASAAIEPPPSPSPPQQQVDGDGGEGGISSSQAGGTGEHEESSTDGVGGDYEGPKTHPPSHN